MPNFDMSQAFPRPDWSICGMPLSEGGVRVIASKELTYAELRVEITRQDIFMFPGDIFPEGHAITGQDIALTTHMRNFVIIDGPDYATCLKHLFEKWSPEPEKRKAIGPKDLGIEGSPTGRINYPSRPAIGS